MSNQTACLPDARWRQSPPERPRGDRPERPATHTSRYGRSWTERVRSLIPDVARLPATRAILDGEVVVLDPKGISDFQALQNALGEDQKTARLVYFVFDLLYLDGFDLTEATLRDRK